MGGIFCRESYNYVAEKVERLVGGFSAGAAVVAVWRFSVVDGGAREVWGGVGLLVLFGEDLRRRLDGVGGAPADWRDALGVQRGSGCRRRRRVCDVGGFGGSVSGFGADYGMALGTGGGAVAGVESPFGLWRRNGFGVVFRFGARVGFYAGGASARGGGVSFYIVSVCGGSGFYEGFDEAISLGRVVAELADFCVAT